MLFFCSLARFALRLRHDLYSTATAHHADMMLGTRATTSRPDMLDESFNQSPMREEILGYSNSVSYYDTPFIIIRQLASACSFTNIPVRHLKMLPNRIRLPRLGDWYRTAANSYTTLFQQPLAKARSKEP